LDDTGVPDYLDDTGVPDYLDDTRVHIKGLNDPIHGHSPFDNNHFGNDFFGRDKW